MTVDEELDELLEHGEEKLPEKFRLVTPEQFKAGYYVRTNVPGFECVNCNYTEIRHLPNGNRIVLNPFYWHQGSFR